MYKRLSYARPARHDALFGLLLVLMAATWMLGGATLDDSPKDDIALLLSLPVLVLGIACLVEQDGLSGHARLAVGCACLIALVPALQLLPLPYSTWSAPGMRHGLAADLQLAGTADALQPHWSLTPDGTERGLWALLPALAGFIAALSLGQARRRRIMQAILLLVFCNVLFAFFQVGLPPESDLRFFEVNSGFGGFLVNTNHQATALIVAMVLAIGLAIDSSRRSRRGHGHPKAHLIYAGFAVFCLLMVPLSTSRAGLVIALPAIGALLWQAGSLRALRRRENRPLAIGALVALLLAFVAVRAALGWMAIDEAEELRHTLTTATLAMAKGQSPLGGGIGSFIPLFEQDAPRALWLNTYVNHAHNEYAQWWLTAGWLGVAVMAVVGAWLAMLVISLARTRGDVVDKAPAAACMVALLAMLAHSWVDYPLRTTTLMTLAGVLTGLMVAAHADMRQRAASRSPRGADAGTPQPA